MIIMLIVIWLWFQYTYKILQYLIIYSQYLTDLSDNSFAVSGLSQLPLFNSIYPFSFVLLLSAIYYAEYNAYVDLF